MDWEQIPRWKKARRRVTQALVKYEMLQNGDRVMVAVSGGKDSTLLLLLLDDIRRKAEIWFELVPVILDQNQPGFDVTRYKTWLADRGFELNIIEEDTYSIVKEKIPEGKTTCSLCSRLRRGILYDYAANHGCHKIALGHHRDDLNQTLLMNLIYIGQMASMPPKLRADDGRNTVIRPLCLVPEEWLIEMSDSLRLPVIPCNLCGSQDGLKRQKTRELIRQLSAENPHIGSSLLKAQQNIKLSQLADSGRFDFGKLDHDSGNLSAFPKSEPEATTL